ncbi:MULTISPECIES: hypothetical protein [unclassified Acidovorax]|uniref:hypothetical protein n=1 Tax=unclassified Acidovorax TaxID=2684926 RepID=UPI0028831F8F|nr:MULTISPECIES: hypothetical protein [unclassified Acidovorax]
MDLLLLTLLLSGGGYVINAQQQRKRIVLLGTHLGQYQIEKLLETLTQGYLRALGEKDAERREQIWALLVSSEAQLSEQFNRFAADFSRVDAPSARVSRLPIGLPFALQLFPSASFDMRKALAVHAQGIARVARNEAGRSPRDKAFMMTAELFLMQHTCHWFCKSRTVASARVMARHQTPHPQLVASVSPETRAAYTALVGA